MSPNKSDADSSIPLIPDTVSKNNLNIHLTPSTNEENSIVAENGPNDNFTNEENSIVAENDPNDDYLAETDKNGDQIKKDFTISQREQTKEWERIIENRFIDSLQEIEKTCRVPPLYEEEIEITIKESE